MPVRTLTEREYSYYASPPHIPSILMRRKTSMMLLAGWSSENIPTADSYTNVTRITNWAIAGKERRFSGRGGIPSEMEEREIKTVD